MNPHRGRYLQHAFVIAASAVTVPAILFAQMPRGADTLSPRAISDSQAVLRDLDRALRANGKDASIWYHRGTVAWVIANGDAGKPGARGIEALTMRRMADTSLRIAAQLDPKNLTYQLATGEFLRSGIDPASRLAAAGFLDRALELARTGSDRAIHATAAVEAGRVRWLRYETEANQQIGCSPDPSLDSASHDLPTVFGMKALHNQLISCPNRVHPGDRVDYVAAEALFREAVAANPSDGRAFTNLAMLVAEGDRWPELAAVAREYTTRQPSDARGWFSLALALHRTNKEAAVAVFDTAVARLEPRERRRLLAFTRLLSPKDSVSYSNANAERRAAQEQAYWTLTDPLWSRPGNEPRTEFLARVAFAELRWTVEELNVRGAESDRGEIYIRYGPPDRILAIRGYVFAHAIGASDASPDGGFSALGKKSVGTLLPAQSDIVTYWDYDMELSVVFWGPPTYGTARFPVLDAPHISNAVEIRPASFDNIAAEKILPMPLNITRFRAGGDSVDVLVLAQAPLAAIRDATVNATVRVDTWLYGRDDTGELRDSSTLNAPGIAHAVYHVASSKYLYRIEATTTGSMVAGRAMEWIVAERDTITGFSLRGFGMSDLLFATTAQPNKPAPARWMDFNVAPLVGPLAAKTSVEVIWENYELGARGGQTAYAVAVTLQRLRSSGGNIVATIIGLAASAVGVERASDRVTFRFDRSGPAAPAAFVDRIRVDMADTPPGDYVLKLQVTDKASGRKTSRSSALTISK